MNILRRSRAVSVRLTLANYSDETTNVVLEPWGEVLPLQPGERREVLYRGDPEPHLSIHGGPGELKIWAEGDGVFESPAASETLGPESQ